MRPLTLAFLACQDDPPNLSKLASPPLFRTVKADQYFQQAGKAYHHLDKSEASSRDLHRLYLFSQALHICQYHGQHEQQDHLWLSLKLHAENFHHAYVFLGACNFVP